MVTGSLRPRSFATRYVTLFGGEAFSKLCVLVAFAYLARAVGPREFGIIELALSITIFFVLGVENGLGSYGARMVAASPEETPRLLPRIMVLRLMLGIPAYLMVLAGSEYYGLPGVGIVAIYGIIVLITPLFTQWVFQGLRQMQWVATGTVLRNLTFVTLVLLLVREGADTWKVAGAEVAGALVLAIFNIHVLIRRLSLRLVWKGAFGGALRLFRETWSMGASDLTWACLWYAPSVIVGAMGIGRTEHVAWLAASVRIVMALHTFVFLYFFNMLPNLSTELSRGLEDWRDLIRRSLGTAMWPACLVALGGTLAAPFIVTLLFGDAYREAVLPFQIVVWMIPITWFSGHYRFSLIAAGQQKWEFWAAAWSAVAMIPAAVVLVFSYGSAGAAVALVFGSLVNTALAMLAVKRRIGSVEALPALSPVVATCLASLVLGMLVALVAGEIPGAVTACIAYAGVAATRAAELTRARIAWLGR